jgi:two-component system chemotaxis response regulator CheY
MKVLIVDDSKAMRMLVVRALRKAGLGTIDVAEADDGKEGLELIRSVGPDLVLSDWNMPGMPGPVFVAALRAEWPNLRFGFVTSEGTDEMRKRASELGAAFLIAKPFAAEDFRRALGS